MAIDLIIDRVSNQKDSRLLTLTREQVTEIARRYHKELKGYSERMKNKYVPKNKPIAEEPCNYAKGYKQGYIDRSNEIYDEELINRYHEYIGKTEVPED